MTLIVVGEQQTRHYTLRPGRTYVVGRGEGVDIQVEDALASRRHAVVTVLDTASILDPGSANGTKVDGVPIAPETAVELGASAVAEIGGTVLFVAQRGSESHGTFLGHPSFVEGIDRVARSHLNVLLQGESGVGKEIMAERIHKRSARHARAFVKVDCAALVDPNMVSELFGQEQSALPTTGPDQRASLLEEADGGTMFLDDVTQLPPVTQAKLLRVLETGVIVRGGRHEPSKVDVRFVAATSRDLPTVIRNGQLREDLFFRLEGYLVQIPPLRERRDEIMALAETFAKETCQKLGRDEIRIAASARRRLLLHPWPGNVRELRNVIARSVVLCPERELKAEGLQLSEARSAEQKSQEPNVPAKKGTKRAHDKDQVLAALGAEGGNQKRAAGRLGVSVRTLQNRLDELGIPRPRK